MSKSEIRKRELQQVDVINKNMNEKRYLCRMYIVGDESMSFGDANKMIKPKREFAFVSTNEIQVLLKYTEPFYQICDYTGEKKWGRYRDIEIFPLTEELENAYLDMSESNFIKGYREFYERNPEICEVA